MNGTCQYHTTCGNLATTTVRFRGRERQICSSCEPEMRAMVRKIQAAAGEAVDQLSSILADHFGVRTQETSDIGQLLVTQLVSGIPMDDVVGNFRQAVNLAVVADSERRARASANQSPPHPHPADWACDHLCRQAPPASPPAPPPTPPSEPQSVAQGAAGKPRTSPDRKAVSRRKLHGGHKFLIGVVAWLICVITGIVLAAHHNHGGFALIILAALTLLGAAVAGIGAIIADGVDQHERWIKQHPTWQQAQIRRAEKAAAWGAVAAGSIALHEHHKRVSAQLSASVMGTGPKPGGVGAAMFEMKQRRQADQRHQELLNAIRISGQPKTNPLDSSPLLAHSEQSSASQRRRRELG